MNYRTKVRVHREIKTSGTRLCEQKCGRGQELSICLQVTNNPQTKIPMYDHRSEQREINEIGPVTDPR